MTNQDLSITKSRPINNVSTIISFLLLVLVAGCARFTVSPAQVNPLSPALAAFQRIEHLYILTFDQWGVLTNPAELDYAIERMSHDPEIGRILILSYGWNQDGRISYSVYQRLLEDLRQQRPETGDKHKWAVIAIGWDSSQTAVRKLMGDILPLPALGEIVAWAPDKMLMGFSFWSKAAYADRIGYGGLRTALNELFAIYAPAEDPPDILLMGHSFGARVIAALLFKKHAGGRDAYEPLTWEDQIAGAMLLQPALVLRNIDARASYPVMVTMSRHDHALGFLYPAANLSLNTYRLTLTESFIQQRIYDGFQQSLDETRSAVGGLMPAGGSHNPSSHDRPSGALSAGSAAGWSGKHSPFL